jgi:hypothetical protein
MDAKCKIKYVSIENKLESIKRLDKSEIIERMASDLSVREIAEGIGTETEQN